jgi:hypothetical protein
MPLERVICHWTAGSYNPNDQDKEHYHFIIDGDGKVVEGDHKPEANISTSDADGYAAHTRACNTGSIGVSIAAMAGAVESPFIAGPYPIKAVQWSAMVSKVAALCKQYGIAVTPRTVLTHAEVQGTLGIQQAGKWDITRLPFEPALIGAKAVGDKLRRDVSIHLSGLQPPLGQVAVNVPRNVTHQELAAAFRKLADEIDRAGRTPATT